MIASGMFDTDQLDQMRSMLCSAWKILCGQGVCGDDQTMRPEQRDLLSRVVLDVFKEGERDFATAVEKCVARYMPLRPEGSAVTSPETVSD